MVTPERQNPPLHPQTLGRYRLRGVLGQGGMGRLYVAEQTGIEGFTKIVALKQILPHLADSPQFRRMFLTEARIAARFEHPNIVATYELGEVDGGYFIAMEYLPGEDLGAILARCRDAGQMPIDIAVGLAAQALSGLQHAHETRDTGGAPAGLVHRDVNPSNIFVTFHGMVKLLDFGVVKGGTTTATSPGVFKGKHGYCAPEQLEGDTIDRRTDLFCVGIVLWECLTGQRLFRGNTDAAIIDAVRGQLVAPPSNFRSDIPPDLDSLVMRALSRKRQDRFQSAFEMSEALDRFLATRPHRPTPKAIGQWLESLFGAERGSLKKAIAQGIEIESALKSLSTMGVLVPPQSQAGSMPRSKVAPQPRTLWSTSVRKPVVPEQPSPPLSVSAALPLPGRQQFADFEPDSNGASDEATSQFAIPAKLAEAAGFVRNLSSYNEPAAEEVTDTEKPNLAMLTAAAPPAPPRIPTPVPPTRLTPAAFLSPASPSASPSSPPPTPQAKAPRLTDPPTMAALPEPPAAPIVPLSSAAPAITLDTPPPRRSTSGGVLKILGVAAGIAVIGIGVMVMRGTGKPAAPVVNNLKSVSLDLTSDPPGAQLFVDGEPTGLVTPTSLSGLRTGRQIELRLDLTNYQPVVQKLDVTAEGKRAYAFKLVPSGGSVTIEGVGPGGTVYVDDHRFEGKDKIPVALGTHKLRVESQGEVVFERTIEVHPGEQTINTRSH